MITLNFKPIFLCLLLLLSTAVSHAEFDMLSTRYMTAYDFQNRLLSMFSYVYAKNPMIMNDQCSIKLALFGFASPATGKPMSLLPNSETVKTIQVCYDEGFNSSQVYLSTANRENYVKFISQFFPESILQEKFSDGAQMNNWHSGLIQSLTATEQEALVAQTVETMLGIDEVIISYGIIKDVNAYRAYLKSKIKADQSILDVISGLTKELALRNEFLTY